MTQTEYLNIIRSASININKRNCNLLDNGIAPSNASLIQLQFLSVIEACYRSIDLFNDEQIDNINNALGLTLTLTNMPNIVYNTTGLTVDDSDVIVAVPTDYKVVYDRVLVLFSSYGGDKLGETMDYNLEVNNVAVQLFNIINSAIAAKASGLTDVATKLYSYVVNKLDNIK